jgi:hypothetical protein
MTMKSRLLATALEHARSRGDDLPAQERAYHL